MRCVLAENAGQPIRVTPNFQILAEPCVTDKLAPERVRPNRAIHHQLTAIVVRPRYIMVGSKFVTDEIKTCADVVKENVQGVRVEFIVRVNELDVLATGVFKQDIPRYALSIVHGAAYVKRVRTLRYPRQVLRTAIVHNDDLRMLVLFYLLH